MCIFPGDFASISRSSSAQHLAVTPQDPSQEHKTPQTLLMSRVRGFYRGHSLTFCAICWCKPKSSAKEHRQSQKKGQKLNGGGVSRAFAWLWQWREHPFGQGCPNLPLSLDASWADGTSNQVSKCHRASTPLPNINRAVGHSECHEALIRALARNGDQSGLLHRPGGEGSPWALHLMPESFLLWK